MKKPKNGAGKGDKPRSCYSKEFKENFKHIDWSKKKFELAPQDKVYLYPSFLHELLSYLFGSENLNPEDCLVTDESTVGDFVHDKEAYSGVKKLEKKYNRAPIKKEDFIWQITEQMNRRDAHQVVEVDEAAINNETK